MSHKLYVVGIGPGSADQMTRAAVKTLESADCLVVARRHLSLAEGRSDVVLLEGLDDTLAEIADRLEKGSVAVAVSGDTGIFSYLKKLRTRFSDDQIVVIPGISALQFLCAALGETWDDAEIVSVHGRDVSPAKIAGVVAHNSRTIFFCGPERDPAWLCRILSECGMDTSDIAVGERLSYPDERVLRGRPSALKGQSFDALSVVRVFNRDPRPLFPKRPKDDEFLRSGDSEVRVPMTREEVRTIILDKLELVSNAVIWDIGAGTGSVSVACALSAPYGEVHAVERLPEAAGLLRRNKEKFKAYNLRIYEGNAASLLESLPRPTHVFIGGSGGELRYILEYVENLGGNIRVVVSGVTFETICTAHEILSSGGFREPDVLQISVARGKAVGGSLIMTAQNPVTLLSAWTFGREDGKA